MFGPIGLFGQSWMDPAYLNHLEYMQMFRPDIAAAAAAAATAGGVPTSTGGSTSPASPTTNTTSNSSLCKSEFKLPLTGMIKPPNPHMDHIFGLRQQLLSAASSAASMAASVAASGSPAVSPQRALLLDGKNSSPASSLERPRSPIDLDDTSNDGSNSVTSPKSLSDRSSSAHSAFRQVKPIHATLQQPQHHTPTPSKLARGHSPDSDTEGPTAAKREKHVWRPY